MNWIRANYDRVAVIAGALFLLLCALFIWRSASTFEENFATMPPTGPTRTAPAPAVELEAAAEKVAQAAAMDVRRALGIIRAREAFHRAGWFSRDIADDRSSPAGA
jgi:hypothetical protein